MAVKIKIRKRVHLNELNLIDSPIIKIQKEKKYYDVNYINPTDFKYTDKEVKANLILFIEASGLPIQGQEESFNLCVSSNNTYDLLLNNKSCVLLKSSIFNGKQICKLEFKIKFLSGIPVSNTAIQLDLNPNSDNLSLNIYLNP
ncbi:MAG: hypothetical protein IPP06_16370 [Saprospiraceae bacterium]|nr:hypothetical protein [Candidatus Vicinibacter affinis]